MIEPNPLEGMRRDPERFRKRLALAIALRHPPTVKWPLLHEISAGRMAPAPGGWSQSRHLTEWHR